MREVGVVLCLLFALAGCARRRAEPYVVDRTPLGADARRHGERELRRMLKDRPAMGHGIREGDALWEWTVGMFAGRGNDRPVPWSAAPPQPGYDADCRMPLDGSAAVIRVRADTDDLEVLWSRAAYELHNSQTRAASELLVRAAMAGSIDKQAYVEGVTRLEYAALGRTWGFYRAIWRPWAHERGIHTERRKWPYRLPSSYGAWIGGFDDPDGYPRDSIGAYYDRVVGRR